MKTIWKGAISFGLVNIPIQLYSASHPRELKFKLLHKKDLSEIRYARICKDEEREVPWKDIVKGYPCNGDYIVMSDDDFERASPKKTKTIEISSFANESEIDSIYYTTPYYLEPEKSAAKSYRLLYEALKRSKKVAIGRFVLRNHEHLVVIKPYENLLMLNQMRFHSELINPQEIAIPDQQPVQKKELAIALELIEHLTEPFDAKNYSDTYTKEIKKIIQAKAKGHKTKPSKEVTAKTPKIHDIVSLLKESLEETKKRPKRRRAA